MKWWHIRVYILEYELLLHLLIFFYFHLSVINRLLLQNEKSIVTEALLNKSDFLVFIVCSCELCNGLHILWRQILQIWMIFLVDWCQKGTKCYLLSSFMKINICDIFKMGETDRRLFLTLLNKISCGYL